MNHPFQIISQFLERVSRDDVEGRALPALPDEIADKLRAFAAGQTPPREREELTLLLKANPHWVSELAREAKSLRPAAEAPPFPPT